jgi:Fis family transcriptional regulator
MNMEQERLTQEIFTRERRRAPLGSTVRTALKLFFSNLDGHNPGSIYQMVIAEVERPMFETVMEYVNGNQSKASKKLKIYDLD